MLEDGRTRSRIVLAVAIAVAIAAAFIGGTPHELPGVALASSFMLHLERGLAGFLGAFLVAVVVLRAWTGHLPVELSQQGVKYASAEAAAETRNETTEAIRDLAAAQTELDDRLTEVEDALTQE